MFKLTFRLCRSQFQLNLSWKCKGESKIRVKIDCGEKENFQAYLNEEMYETQKLFNKLGTLVKDSGQKIKDLKNSIVNNES
jgi:hypothetical protein